MYTLGFSSVDTNSAISFINGGKLKNISLIIFDVIGSSFNSKCSSNKTMAEM